MKVTTPVYRENRKKTIPGYNNERSWDLADYRSVKGLLSEEGMMTEMNIQDWVNQLPQYFIPEKSNGIDATIQLNLSGDGGGEWAVLIHDQKLEVVPGEVSNPRLVMSGNAQDVLQILSGQMDGMRAFMQGKLKVQGDMSLAMKMASLFKRPG
jgi:putative sterol carrier protein